MLLDNLAVPSEARIRSICFLGYSLPGIKIRLDGFPSCALAARAACAAVASNKTEQELQTGNLAAGQRGSTPSGQAGIILDLEIPVKNKIQYGERLSEKDRRTVTFEYLARGWCSRGARKAPVNPKP